MGESLFYSWLRHVKECQIVQLNWKPSPQWQLHNEEDLFALIEHVDKHFQEKHGYEIFKQNRNNLQIIQQTECDALGISGTSGEFFGVDVAFHSGGLNYGSKETTIMKLLAKAVRTALCLRGYLGTNEGNIIFASPKIHKGILVDLLPCVEELNQLFRENKWDFTYRVICNADFKTAILDPVLLVSDGIADTTELFLRSYQMIQMFPDTPVKENKITIKRENTTENPSTTRTRMARTRDEVQLPENGYEELKIGQLAQGLFRKYFHEQEVEEEILLALLSKDESKRALDLNYPAFVEKDSDFQRIRYYGTPYLVNGKEFHLTSQWYEYNRGHLLRWIQNSGFLI